MSHEKSNDVNSTRRSQLSAFFDSVAVLYPTLKWEEHCSDHVQTIRVTVPAKSAKRLRERLEFALEAVDGGDVWVTLVYVDSGLGR